MKRLDKANFDEVVLCFLKAERSRVPSKKHRLVDYPNTRNEVENASRLDLLASLRGGLLARIPPTTTWDVVLIDLRKDKLLHIGGCGNNKRLRNNIKASAYNCGPIICLKYKKSLFVIEGNHRVHNLPKRGHLLAFVGRLNSLCYWDPVYHRRKK